MEENFKDYFTQMGADYKYADGSRENQRKSVRKKEDFSQIYADTHRR